MELRDLKAFVTLGEVLHFGQAAARQHITQSALSKQIRRLEGEFGGELFERNASSTRLTGRHPPRKRWRRRWRRRRRTA